MVCVYMCVIMRGGIVPTNTRKSFLLLLLIVFLCSCGDETTKVVENRTLDYESYDSIDDLPDCTYENRGQLVWVDEESQPRICADEKWYAMMPSDSVAKSLLSCYTQIDEDSTGYAVICNGDSIGFVRNGTLIDNRKDKDCSVLFVDGDTLEIACDSLVSLLVKDSAGNLNPHETELDSEQIALNLEDIGGYSQKGPFVTGSEVVVYELQNGRTLKQTGKSFQGSISNDKGFFNVRTVKVASQYAYLVAKGIYLNEVSGTKSDAPIQLSAITDLRNRNSVNINILTHLEYERVVNLVVNKKMTVASAKKQAQKEIFDVFHIKSEKFVGGSEDFLIGGSGEEDAALLAISIMLQMDDNTASLSKRINALSSSIADSGAYESSARLDMANWASRADSLGYFSSFRKYVESFGLSIKVADFEKHIRHFWNGEYGLDDCDSLGKIVAATRGPLKDSLSRFVCEDRFGIHGWRFASVDEREVYKKKPAADGTLDTAASGNVYIYDSLLAVTDGNGWRLADEYEQEFAGCRMDLNGMIVSTASFYFYGQCNNTQRRVSFFQCDGKNRKWVDPEDCSVVDTHGWDDGTDGELRYGDSLYDGITGGSACYMFDSLDGKWQSASIWDCAEYGDLGGCTRAREGKISMYDGWSYVKCGKRRWDFIDRLLGEDVWQQECEPWVIGSVRDESRYVCRDNEWRKATAMEKKIGAPCFDQDTISYSADSAYVCYTGLYVDEFFRMSGPGWKKAAVLRNPQKQKDYLNEALAYDSIVDSRDGRVYKTIRIGENVWTAENMLYFDRVTMDDKKTCYGDNTSECEMWRQYYWPAAMKISGLYLSSIAKEVVAENHRGVCPEGWHIPSVAESESLLAAAGSFKALFSAKRHLIKSSDYEVAASNGYWYIGEVSYDKGSNASGFSAVNGSTFLFGYVDDENVSVELSNPKICWWTMEEVSDSQAKAFCAGIDEDFDLIEIRSKEDMLPVRCVKDKEGDE